MTEEQAAVDKATEMARALMEFMNSMDMIRESVTGYRTKLLEDGFGVHAADLMAAQFHEHVLKSIRGEVKA